MLMGLEVLIQDGKVGIFWTHHLHRHTKSSTPYGKISSPKKPLKTNWATPTHWAKEKKKPLKFGRSGGTDATPGIVTHDHECIQTQSNNTKKAGVPIPTSQKCSIRKKTVTKDQESQSVKKIL